MIGNTKLNATMNAVRWFVVMLFLIDMCKWLNVPVSPFSIGMAVIALLLSLLSEVAKGIDRKG